MLNVLKDRFQESNEYINKLVVLYKTGQEKIIELLNAIFRVFFLHFNIVNFIDAFRHSIKIKSKNTEFKIHILQILEQGFKIKAQQKKIQELMIFRDKFEYSFQRLDIDADQAIRKMSQKLVKTLNQYILMNAQNSSDLKDVHEISDINMDPEVSNMIRFPTMPPKNETRSSFQPETRNSHQSFFKGQIQPKQTLNKIRSTSNYQGVKAKDEDSSHNDNSVYELREMLNKQQANKTNRPTNNAFEDKLDLINWNQKNNKKLLEELTELFGQIELPPQDTNSYLEKLSKKTNDFADISGKSYLQTFLASIVNNSNVFINQTTFINLKQVIQKDLQSGKSEFSYRFLEKLLVSIGPFHFFTLIFNYFSEKGFNSKNFFQAIFLLVQSIPEILFYDGHLIILYRNATLNPHMQQLEFA